ncbi:INO80 complex subunit C [Nibea albiflora]|uniref:INO80 complex subunit C n=1 Tax=Nibea albiflora TaxID=240163 RepID=A0ACB7F7V8_NIBAL|nr:INO80 complex subunit C [Nibea albiflora]
MSRRSTRLEAAGYYDKFSGQRKTNFRAKTQAGDNTVIITSDRAMFSWKILGFFLLPLCFGCGYLVSTLGNNDLRELQDQLLELKNKLNSLHPEANNLPNLALESLGTKIVHLRTSESYQTPESEIKCFGIPIYRRPVSPTIVIRGHSHLTPGQCWAFPGGLGQLFIAPSRPFTISHVTLSHISKNMSPTGSISSAPKEFSVYGLYNVEEEVGVYLGSFLYDQDGDSVQTFKVPPLCSPKMASQVPITVRAQQAAASPAQPAVRGKKRPGSPAVCAAPQATGSSNSGKKKKGQLTVTPATQTQHSGIGGAAAGKKNRTWKNLKQILALERTLPWKLNDPNYYNIDAPPSLKPTKKYSDISGLPANYTDPQTKLRFTSSEEFSYIRLLPTDVVTGYLALRKATCIVP